MSKTEQVFHVPAEKVQKIYPHPRKSAVLIHSEWEVVLTCGGVIRTPFAVLEGGRCYYPESDFTRPKCPTQCPLKEQCPVVVSTDEAPKPPVQTDLEKEERNAEEIE